MNGVGDHHAAFLNESRTRGHVQRCVAGKSGYAPVEMMKNASVPQPPSMEPLPFPLSSRAKPSDCLNWQANGGGPSGGCSRGFCPVPSPWTGAPCLRRRSRGTTWVEQDGAKPLPMLSFPVQRSQTTSRSIPGEPTMRRRGICGSTFPGNANSCPQTELSSRRSVA